jgi:hypothetical protein
MHTFIRLPKHSLNLFLPQIIFVVFNSDSVRLASCLVRSRNVEDTVRVNLPYTTQWGRNAREFEFSKEIVVFGPRTLTFGILG